MQKRTKRNLASIISLPLITRQSQWRTQGGNGGGVRTPPLFKEVGSRFAQKCYKKLVGGVRQICKEVASEILEKQPKIGSSRVGSKVLVSKKCLNTAGRGILSQR